MQLQELTRYADVPSASESRRNSQPILVVEDSDEDYTAFRRALGDGPLAAPIFRCESGDDCLDYLNQSGKYAANGAARPGLILLDLNLPGTDGREVLEILDADISLRSIPVVVLTTSTNPQDVELCYRHGANTYFTKPQDWKRFSDNMRLLMAYWFSGAVLPGELS